MEADGIKGREGREAKKEREEGYVSMGRENIEGKTWKSENQTIIRCHRLWCYATRTKCDEDGPCGK